MAITDIDQARHESIRSAGAGFPFLLCFGVTWTAAGAISYLVDVEVAAWVYLLQAVVAAPCALGLQRWLGYPKASPDNPLWPLAMQLFFIQALAFPAYILVLELEPALVPVVFAALVGAHFLPYQWLHKTRLYGVLGVIVAVGPWLLAVLFGKDVIHYSGYFVGIVLIGGAYFARQHAARYLDIEG